MARRKLARPHLTIEQLEARVLLHGDPGYDLTDHVHQHLSIFINDNPVSIPTDIGVTDTAIIDNPHTHADDGVLHYHPLNGQPDPTYPTLGDFFRVWRTNAGNAGNNPNATFSANELMGNVEDANHRILMYVNGAPNYQYDQYVLRDGDQIVLSYETIPGPNDPFLQPIGNLTAAAGKSLIVPLNATDPQGDALTYTVTTSDPRLEAQVLQGDRLLRLDVSGTDDEGNPFSGTLLFYLFETLVPNTTARIIQLAQSGFYDGLTFHRIIDGFVIQGGDPNGDGTGGSGVRFDDEFRADLTFTGGGQLAMANSGDDTNDSQFFVTDTNLSLNMEASPSQLPPQHLNFQHTIFGQLVAGFDVFEKIITTPTDANDRPLNPVTITDASVVTDPGRAVLMLKPSEPLRGDVTVEITVSDPQGNTDFRRFNVRVVEDTVNDPPFLGPVQDLQTLEEQPVQFTLTATDLENDPLTFVVRDAFTFQPSQAVDVSVTDNGDGTATVTLTPRENVTGVVQLIAGVRDQIARSGLPLDHRNQFDTQRFQLTIEPINDAPAAEDVQVTTGTDTPVEIQLLGDDGDPDALQQLTFEIVTQPSNGSISNFDPATGLLTYTPNPGFVGTDTFTYRVRDDGGTANGGVDTSAEAVVTVTVGPVPAKPTQLQLAPRTDSGARDDGFTRHPQPVVRVKAEPGVEVWLQLNGQQVGPLPEVRPGWYKLTLDPSQHPLQPGPNELVAYAVKEGLQSPLSDPMQLVWAPQRAETYLVPGPPKERVQLTFTLSHRIASFKNEVGFVVADGPDGSVDGVRPGQDEYARKILEHPRRRRLFGPDDPVGTERTVQVPAGKHLVFYLIQDATAEQWLSENPENQPGEGPVAFFSVAKANPDGIDHVRHHVDPYTGAGQYAWEDLLGGGDLDFNDLVFTVQTADSPARQGLVRAAGVPGKKVKLTALLRKPATGSGRPLGEVGLFPVDGPQGAVAGTEPGDPGFLRAVAQAATVRLFARDTRPGTEQEVLLDAGQLYGFYYVVGGTLQEAIERNPSNDPSQEPFVLFSIPEANPGGREGFRWFEPERRGISPDRFENLTDDVLRVHVVDRLLQEEVGWFDQLLFELTLDEAVTEGTGAG